VRGNLLSREKEKKVVHRAERGSLDRKRVPRDADGTKEKKMVVWGKHSGRGGRPFRTDGGFAGALVGE